MPVSKGYNIKLIKTELRKQFRSYRANLKPFKKKLYDTAIMYNLLNLEEYKKASTIFIYISLDSEIDTYQIIEQCWKDRKTVVVPRCIPETKGMEFYIITSFDDLEPGIFSLKEPITQKCSMLSDYSKGLCVVPGLAFDVQGYRLGYGMGYYDRFLSAFEGDTVGLCYADNVQHTLPHGYFDRPVCAVITDNFVRRISQLEE